MSVEGNEVLFVALAGALAGGLVTAINTIVLGLFNRSIKRRKLHYNSLVRLEQHLNNVGSVVNDNIQTIDILKRSVENIGGLAASRFSVISISADISFDIADIELKNRFFKIEIFNRRHNEDVNNFNHQLDLYESAALEGSLSPQDYHWLANDLLVDADTLSRHFSYSLEQVIELLAYIRISLARNTKWDQRVTRWIAMHRYKNPTSNEIKNEIKIVQSEIEKSRIESIKLSKKLRQK